MPDTNQDKLFEQYGFTADKSKSDAPDFGDFLSGASAPSAKEPEKTGTVEEYIAPADAPAEPTDPSLDYMGNMQNMFQSLSQDTTALKEPVKEEEPDPKPELSSFLYGKDGDVPVKSQTDLLSSETQPFRSAPTAEVPSEGFEAEEKGASTEPGTAGSEQQMNSMNNSENKNETKTESTNTGAPRKEPPNPKKAVEKGEEYWSFVDSLLDNFDDTQSDAHARIAASRASHARTEQAKSESSRAERKERSSRKSRAQRVSAEEAATAVATATSFEESGANRTAFDDDLLSDFSLGAGSSTRRKERRTKRSERKASTPLTTRASEASASEAKSSGEAPAAGSYFMPGKGKQTKHGRHGLNLSVRDVDDTVLQTPVAEAPAVEAPKTEQAVPPTPSATEKPVTEAPKVEPVAPVAEASVVEPSAPAPAAPVAEETPVVTPFEPTPAPAEETVPAEEPKKAMPFWTGLQTSGNESDLAVTAEAVEDEPALDEKDLEKEAAAEEKFAEKQAFEEEQFEQKQVAEAEKFAEKQAAKEAKLAEKKAAEQAKLTEKKAAEQAKLEEQKRKLAEKQTAEQAKLVAQQEKAAEKQAAKEAKLAEKQAKAAAKQASKEAKAAEKQAAKEAKAAEKQAAKEAKAAEKQAAKEAKAAGKSATVTPDKASANSATASAKSTAPAAPHKPSADTPVIHEEKTTLGPAPGATALPLGDFDPNARNEEFESTYVDVEKPKGALRIIRNILVILAALVIVACIAVLGYNFAQTKTNARQFEQASTLLKEGQKAKDLTAVQKKYPDIKFPATMDPAFGELYAQNQDLVGWISIPGTELSYPVVQTDNDSFYQNHNLKKASSPYGVPFLSSKNDASELDLNTVIYGLSAAKEPRVFGDLEQYRSADYFKKHPVIQYQTLSDTYRFKVYGVFVTNSDPEQDNGYLFDYTVPNLGTVDSFAGYIDQINQRRLYDTGVDVVSTDKVLTLSTNADDFNGARLVVVARLIRDGEAKGIDESQVKTNQSPRHPQVWYDKNGKKNPYTSSDNWIPTIS